MSTVAPVLPYRPDIDGLRAIAVLAVVAYHASPRVLPGGFVGVDVFFVISGFLISSLIVKAREEGRFSIVDFYRRRILRLMPALLLVLACTWALGWALLTPAEFDRLGLHLAAGTTFLSNFTLWRESGYFDGEAALKPLLHLWSLAIEEQFYLFWPAFLLLLWPLGRRRLLLAAAVVAALSLGANLLTVPQSPGTGFFLPHTRFWELILGAGLSLVALPAMRPAVRDGLSLAGLALIVAAMLAFSGALAYPGWRALLPTVGALLLIAAGPAAWVNRQLLSRRLLVMVGLVSYPLYLWHWPLLVFQRLLPEHDGDRWTRIAAVALALGLAWLTWRWVERPVRHAASPQGRTLAASAMLAMLGGLLLVGLATQATQGFPARFPPHLQYLIEPEPERFDIRIGRCFLEPEQGAEDFAAECGHGQVALWGDSHAAHLMAGLTRLSSVAQFTASACPPILDADIAGRPQCRHINDSVARQIAEADVRTVVLAANWSAYPVAAVEPTIVRLRAEGRQVVLVGPVPAWDQPLPRQLLFLGRSGPLPARLRPDSLPALEALDGRLEAIAQRTGARYLSPLRLLCNADGCRVRVAPSRVTSFDRTHLTTSASVYTVVALFEGQGLHLNAIP